MFGNEDIVPVVMFHSVGLAGTDWVFSHISEPLECFEEKIAALCRAGYHFLFWDDLYAHMAGSRKAPRRSVMLTFDDGYLDNWVLAFPILKKYGARCTIFVNPAFVDPEPVPRPTLDDARAGKNLTALESTGFLSWAEMQAMESSGIVDIQSHSLTHTWYFSGPNVVDFHRPGSNRYPWLFWNSQPERKPFYMAEDQSGFVPAGTPVYEHEKALICRRYFPPESVLADMATFVSKNGGDNFFFDERWAEKLKDHHASLVLAHENDGRMESEDEYRERVFSELRNSKMRIEENLKKQVDYICWPGGGYNDTVLSLARKVGYKSWTIASKDQSNFRNLPGAGMEQIKRVGSFSHYQIPGWKPIDLMGGRYFLCGIERHKGSLFHKWLGRTLLVVAQIRNIVEFK
jgi:peptidoglycan/xylan/chitin deacetylase (PgdA/CDA1 family)